MNAEEEYASNSEESDEDFCPEKEAGSSDDAVSEASSDDCENSQDEEDVGEVNKQSRNKESKAVSRKSKKAKKKLNKPQSEEQEEKKDQNSRRCTRQTDDSRGNGKNIEKDEIESDEEDKSRTDALWAHFLSDVKPANAASKRSVNSRLAVQDSGSATASVKFTNGCSTKKSAENSFPNSTDDKESKSKTVTEILDFAGEEVRVEKVVNADSIKETKWSKTTVGVPTVSTRASQPGLKRPSSSGGGGLGSILNQLGKKKKMSVLEKTQMDWKSFKQNEGIEEELLTHNKGKDGFLERQDFLQRTDVRQFEIEKSLRQSKRSN